MERLMHWQQRLLVCLLVQLPVQWVRAKLLMAPVLPLALRERLVLLVPCGPVEMPQNGAWPEQT